MSVGPEMRKILMDFKLKENRSMVHFEYKIHFFSLQEKIDSYFYSPDFLFLDATWYFAVRTFGSTDFNTQRWIGLFLGTKHSVTFDQIVTYTLGIKKEDGTELDSFTDESNFKGVARTSGKFRFLKTSVLLKQKLQYAPNDTVTFFCKLHAKARQNKEASVQTVLAEGIHAYVTKNFTEDDNTKGDDEQRFSGSTGVKVLLENFKNLFLSGENSDIIINVRDQEFKAHRTILGARSRVFSSMFSHDTIEKNTGAIEITDCQPGVFYVFLRYLYSGQVEEVPDDQVLELYVVADKYDVQDLKEECVKCAITHLSVENVCDIISLALLYNETALLQRATNFFQENVRRIIVTANWISFLKKNPIEANELHIKALDYLHSKRNLKNIS